MNGRLGVPDDQGIIKGIHVFNSYTCQNQMPSVLCIYQIYFGFASQLFVTTKKPPDAKVSRETCKTFCVTNTMSKIVKEQENSEAPSFKDKLNSKLKNLKPYAVLAKGAIASFVSASLVFGLGYFAVATKYPGSIDIQIPNALTLKINNQGQQK